MKPPRLDIPDNGFTYSVSDYEPHLGHIIRPTTPLSSRPSLHIDTSLHQQQQNLPRTTSTNGSISTLRRYRRAMTPRVGIRTSLFSAIEVSGFIQIKINKKKMYIYSLLLLFYPISFHF